MSGMESGLQPVLETSTEDPKVVTISLNDSGMSGGESLKPSEDECLLERSEKCVWVIGLLPMGGESYHTSVYREYPKDT